MNASRLSRCQGAGVWVCVVVVLAGARVGWCQSPPQYERTTHMVAMRDGVKLNTVLLRPKRIETPLPVILMRTPYDAAGRAQGQLRSYLKDLADAGYLFVFQDIRGRYGSEGTFVMMRPPRDREDAESIDEGTDSHDTIEWILANVPGHNGRVGMLGISYPGWLTTMALIEPHPALKAASPQAPPADMFLGDDFHHNGAFRLSYSFEYAHMMENSNVSKPFAFDAADTFEWYLNLGPLRRANELYLKGNFPSWNDFIAHPNYDAFWQRQAVAPYLKVPTVPTLNVAGWWDQEDFFGPLKTYAEFEAEDAHDRNFLVVGPWNHGGWASGAGDRLGPIEFGASTGPYFRKEIQAAFFARFLKDEASSSLSEARTFRTGENAWQSYQEWPPKSQTTPRKLYLRAGGALSFDPPDPPSKVDPGFDAYVSDPSRPVPYRARPIQPTYGKDSTWSTWLVQDQRFAHLRPDVLSYSTEPLEHDMVVTGPIVAHLFGSTSGTDCDWVVKIIDVHPDAHETLGGYQLMVANEVFRARFRNSFEHPEPMIPDQAEEFVIDTHGCDHRFKQGHRIMLQVQSTWFPLIDRNPQTFVPNIFEAEPGDFVPTTQRVFRTGRLSSFLELPVMP